MRRTISVSQLQGVACALIVLLHAGITYAACPAGGICYVDDNCSTSTDGTSSNPDCTIQEGINRAANGESVLVRAGSYGAIVLDGSKGITVKRETTAILPKITNTSGPPKVQFNVTGGTANSVLDGFEITGANTRGIDVSGASPTIKNCTIWGNHTTGEDAEGAGIRLINSNAEIIDCVIGPDNQTSSAGGGIYIDPGAGTARTPQITGCTIDGNTSSGSGGGIGIFDSYPVITYCVISGNTANGVRGGGGIWVSPAESYEEGGASGGSSCADGCSAGGAVKLTNCLVVGNSASNAVGKGGGLFLSSVDEDGRTEISNCTISGNTATGDGDGIYGSGFCFTLRNSILWDNGPGGLGSEITLLAARAFLRYNDIEGGLTDIKLISSFAFRCEESTCSTSQILNSNPNFCAAPTDYRLCRVSPCIDAGDNSAVPTGITVDLDGAPRLVNDLCTTDTGCGSAPIVDMGAYEYQVVQSQIDGDWKSLVTHGASNTIGLDVLSDSTFSESRNGGVTKLRLNFSSPIDPATVSASNVVICGNDVNSQAVNLSGITITTTVLSGNAAVDINFSPKLPNYARYRVHLDDVEDVDCNVISANNERIFTSLFGDATRDLRVLQADVGYVNSLVGTSPIDPNTTPQVRSDVDNDNDIDSTDVSLVTAEVPKTGAPSISNPSCP